MAKIISYEIHPWSGAVDTWNRILEEGKETAFYDLVEELYPDGVEETTLNDWLWFEPESVFEMLGITNEEESDDE